MVAAALNKKKSGKPHKAPSKKKQKTDIFTGKRSKKADIQDDSDVLSEEELKEHGEFNGEEEEGSDSGSGSELFSDGDDPLADDFLQGSEDEGVLLSF